MNPLTVAIFLAVVNTKLIDYIKAPIQKKYPELDLWWLAYVALLTGMGLTWLAQVNLFGEFIANVTAGILLSGVVVGGGSSLIYDIFSKPAATVTAQPAAGESVTATVHVKGEK